MKKALMNDPALVLPLVAAPFVILFVLWFTIRLDGLMQPRPAPDMTQRQGAEVSVSASCNGLFNIGSCNTSTTTEQAQAQAPAAPAPNGEHASSSLELAICAGLIMFAMALIVLLAARPQF